MSVCRVCARCLWRLEKGVGAPGTEVTDGCKLPCRCWVSNPGPLEQQPVLVNAESYLQFTMHQNFTEFFIQDKADFDRGRFGDSEKSSNPSKVTQLWEEKLEISSKHSSLLILQEQGHL